MANNCLSYLCEIGDKELRSLLPLRVERVQNIVSHHHLREREGEGEREREKGEKNRINESFSFMIYSLVQSGSTSPRDGL